jgi:hypothetical protein
MRLNSPAPIRRAPWSLKRPLELAARLHKWLQKVLGLAAVSPRVQANGHQSVGRWARSARPAADFVGWVLRLRPGVSGKMSCVESTTPVATGTSKCARSPDETSSFSRVSFAGCSGPGRALAAQPSN